jgi:hypothetical protein
VGELAGSELQAVQHALLVSMATKESPTYTVFSGMLSTVFAYVLYFLLACCHPSSRRELGITETLAIHKDFVENDLSDHT